MQIHIFTKSKTPRPLQSHSYQGWARIGAAAADTYVLDADLYNGRLTLDRNLVADPLSHNIGLLVNGSNDHSLVFHGPIVPNEVI